MSDSKPTITQDAIRAALIAAAPGAGVGRWLQPVSDALLSCSATTPLRVAAWLGQASVEAGSDFSEIEESLYYTSVGRIMQVFGVHFTGPDEAASYLKSPERLANKVYAGRLGNGDEGSGDGWLCRGGGLIQVTGRDNYTAYAKARKISFDEAVARVRTDEGAADVMAWFWQAHNLNILADQWAISAITRVINGTEMMDNVKRIAASNAARRAVGGEIPTG